MTSSPAPTAAWIADKIASVAPSVTVISLSWSMARPYTRRRIAAMRPRSAKDQHVGPEEPVHLREVLVDALDPGRKVEVFRRAHARRGPFLGVHAAELEVPELGVGKELAAGEKRRADPGAEGQHDHRAFAAPARTPAHLGEPRGVGVVEEQHRSPERLRGERGAVGAHPGGA